MNHPQSTVGETCYCIIDGHNRRCEDVDRTLEFMDMDSYSCDEFNFFWRVARAHILISNNLISQDKKNPENAIISHMKSVIIIENEFV